MKKVVKLTDAKLNSIIKKVLQEQEEEQYMKDVDPTKMSGGAEPTGNENGEPDFTAFLDAAKELMSNGVTIGNLVDKLCEAKDQTEPEAEEPQVDEPPVPPTA